ncbi:MAG: helix-turn-helix domain-containing protein [Actinomycetia bacterium]|nr:helix-turn-helix domain-containing protein [Actinomycetes bacterium]
MEAEKLLTARELAEYLNVPVAWCWKVARDGTLPSVRLPGGRRFLRFDLEAVMAVLEAGEAGDGDHAAL